MLSSIFRDLVIHIRWSMTIVHELITNNVNDLILKKYDEHVKLDNLPQKKVNKLSNTMPSHYMA